MPRRPSGPKLVALKKKGWTRSIYYIRWYERGNKREQSTGESGYEEAQEKYLEFLGRQAQPKAGDRIGPYSYPIATALANYAEEHAPTTEDPERIAIAVNHLIEYFGDDTAGEITEEKCAAYCRHRGVSDGTLRRELGVLRAALNRDVKKERLERAPFVWLPSRPPHRERWLNRSEVAALLWATRTPQARLYMPLFVLIALYTGARKSAILELTWPQIDLVRGRINFNQPGRRQTLKRRPTIPIPNDLSLALKRAQARASCKWVINRDGEQIADIKKGFAGACERAGLEDVTPHTLRHTAGTWMAQAGVDLYQIGGYLGQSHERTTELYAHHHPDYMEAAVNAL